MNYTILDYFMALRLGELPVIISGNKINQQGGKKCFITKGQALGCTLVCLIHQ